MKDPLKVYFLMIGIFLLVFGLVFLVKRIEFYFKGKIAYGTVVSKQIFRWSYSTGAGYSNVLKIESLSPKIKFTEKNIFASIRYNYGDIVKIRYNSDFRLIVVDDFMVIFSPPIFIITLSLAFICTFYKNLG